MPLLDPSIPFGKTAHVTKSLRARDRQLLALLPTARELFDGAQNIYFPRQNEWLLEWLAQRLKEEDDPAGRASPESWRLLVDLLGAVEDPNAVSVIMKKHSVVSAVGRMMGELRKKLEDETLPTLNMDAMDIDEEEDPVIPNLEAVATVLETLRGLGANNGSVMVATKVPVETSAALLGNFFGVSQVLLRRTLTVQTNWVENVLWLWRSGVWGNSNTKKISTSWSEKCLQPASILLMDNRTPVFLKSTLEEMISEYIFPLNILQPTQAGNSKNPSKPSTNELTALLRPLQCESTNLPEKANTTSQFHLPVMFKVALKTLQRKQHAKPEPETVEAIYRALLAAVLDLDLSTNAQVSQEGCNNISALLEAMTAVEIALPLNALVEIVMQTANLNRTPNNIRWDIVEQVLRNDFDAFLHPSNNLLAQDLFSAITISQPSEQLSRVMDLLIEGFTKARDLLGFIKHWKEGLPADIWALNSIKKSFAKRVESSLIPTQIERLVKDLGKEQQWDILDATLRGIGKPETEKRLISSGILPEIVASAVKETEPTVWRVIVRIADIEPGTLSGAFKRAKKIIKKLDTETEEVGLLAAEIILRSTDDPKTNDVEATQQVLEACANGWKGKVPKFANGVAVAVAGRFLSALELVGSETRCTYVDSLLEAALSEHNAPVNAVWRSMVQNPSFFEYPALKDAVLSALLAKLDPYPSLAHDVPAALKSKSKTKAAIVPGKIVELVAFSIMQYPLDAIKRNHRETILDTLLLLEVCGEHTALHPVIHKLWRVGNATSQLTQSVDVFRTLFQLPGAENTAKRILQHAVSNSDQEKMKDFLRNVLTSAQGVSTTPVQISDQDLTFSWTTLTGLWGLTKGDQDTEARLKEVRKNVLEALDQRLSTTALHQAHHLRMWREIWALERDERGGVWDVGSRVTKHLVSQSPPLGSDTEATLESISLVFDIAASAEDSIAASALAVFALEILPLDLHPRVLSPYRSLLVRLPQPDHSISLESLAAGCLSDEISPVAWQILKVHVDTISSPPVPVSPTSPAIAAVARFQILLTLRLPQVTSAVAFYSILTSLDSLIRNQQWSTTQHQIDSTIASLTILTSPNGPTISATSEFTPESLYLSIVSPISAILSFHRQRVRNRYHLLISLLSQLLSLLFNPRLTRRKSDLPTHPPWILTTSVGNGPGPHLSITAARAFSRVVQNLCEPPASTVRSHNRGNREQLESEIRREKKMVAKSVGPLLEVYVKRVLEERIDGDVKKEVALGIGFVAEVLGKDGMARVGDRMSVEGRAVLREIWKDLGLRRRERV